MGAEEQDAERGVVCPKINVYRWINDDLWTNVYRWINVDRWINDQRLSLDIPRR